MVSGHRGREMSLGVDCRSVKASRAGSPHHDGPESIETVAGRKIGYGLQRSALVA